VGFGFAEAGFGDFDEAAVFKFYPGEEKASALKDFGRRFIARFHEEFSKKEDPGN